MLASRLTDDRIEQNYSIAVLGVMDSISESIEEKLVRVATLWIENEKLTKEDRQAVKIIGSRRAAEN
jgi:hypothetical protein